jgi:hypothetical protein
MAVGVAELLQLGAYGRRSAAVPMMQSMGGNMKVLSKVHVVAQRNGWSLARAQGFVEGEMSRRRGAAPSIYARVGIDEYCLGFRAGYYERRTSQPKGAVTSLAGSLEDTAAIARNG